VYRRHAQQLKDFVENGVPLAFRLRYLDGDHLRAIRWRRKMRQSSERACEGGRNHSDSPELPFDPMAAMQSASVRAYLEARGLPIGPYDTLLAGQALVLALTLVSANVKEFNRVPGLRVENWQV
jgi:predicted nucleic acid-binding protein